jgi:hypothetical protein
MPTPSAIEELWQSNTLSPTAMSVVVLLFVLLIPFTALMVYAYADRKTPVAYLIFVFVGWYSGFAGTLLLPIDIANTVATGASATVDSPLTFVWRIVGYITMAFAWVLSPFAMEFRAAGGFTWLSKMKYAVKSNCVSYVVLLAIIIACVVLIIVLRLSYKTLMPLLSAVGNIYGLCFIVVLMSYGLVEIPRTLWSVCKGPRTLLRRLQFEAPTREAELFDAITEFSTAMGQVRALEAALAEEAGGSSALDHGLHTILDAANETLREVSASSQWSTSIAIDDGAGGGADNALWDVDGGVSAVSTATKLQRMETVHATIKTAGQRVRVAIEMWKRLLLDARALQNLVDDDGVSKPAVGARDKAAKVFRECVGPVAGKALAVFFAALSVAILWCELSIGSSTFFFYLPLHLTRIMLTI